MASIGYEDEWNILHRTHTKLVHYCWEPLTIEYPGSWDKNLKVWRLSDLKCLESIKAHDDAINGLVASNGMCILLQLVGRLKLGAGKGRIHIGSADKSIGIWKRDAWGKEGKNSHASKGILKGHKEVSINSVIVSEDGKWVYGGGMAVLCTCQTGEFLCSGSAGKSIGIWERGACGMLSKVGVISGHEGPIKRLQASPSNIGGGFLLYSGSLDKSIRVWWVPKNTANRDDHDTSSMESAVKSSGIMMC
nr:protein JINGUBANG-like [Quercus suber]